MIAQPGRCRAYMSSPVRTMQVDIGITKDEGGLQRAVIPLRNGVMALARLHAACKHAVGPTYEIIRASKIVRGINTSGNRSDSNYR